MVLREKDRAAFLGRADYDGRTPAHLAAAEDQADVMRFFDESGVDLAPEDRWGGTPPDDTHLRGNAEIIALLESRGARRGPHRVAVPAIIPARDESPSSEAVDDPMWAASRGSVETFERLVAHGQRIDVADYDLRTPLHLAAAEGHASIVEYPLGHGHHPQPRDRWGNTPLDDAVRHGHVPVAELLKKAVAGA